MKTELTDVSDTEKHLTVEIPSDVVDARIAQVIKGYSKKARIPGFRPGKAPSGIIKQRFKDQILQDVARELVPKAVDEALQERGVEPLDSPDIRDFAIDEGQPLKFTAVFETVPSFDPGDLSTIAIQQPSTTLPDDAVDQAMQRLRDRAARFEPVEGRPIADGDTAVLDIDRTDAKGAKERHEQVSITIGASANPPGFDANLIGLSAGDAKTFEIHFPEDYAVEEMRNTDMSYSVAVKDIRQRVLPTLDDEFAKDLGEFETLEALRERVRTDLQAEAESAAKHEVRHQLLAQLSRRVTFALPEALVDREVVRRIEEFARRLMEQQIDPRQANIDWGKFREAQQAPARDSVATAIVLDEIARRESLVVTPEALDKEIEQLALQLGRTPPAVRAQLEKDGGISRIYTGLRREKAVDFAMARAKIATA